MQRMSYLMALTACLALLATLSAVAVVETRLDIDPARFPSSWDVSRRTSYQVDVATSPLAALETMPIPVVARVFDLNSYIPGLMLVIR